MPCAGCVQRTRPPFESIQATRVDGGNAPGVPGSIRSSTERIVPGLPSAASAFDWTSTPGSWTSVTTRTAAAATAATAKASPILGTRRAGASARTLGRICASACSTWGSATSKRAGSAARSRTAASLPASSSPVSSPSSARANRAASSRSSRRNTDSLPFEPFPQPPGSAQHDHLAGADATPGEPRDLGEGVPLDEPEVDNELVVAGKAPERLGERLPEDVRGEVVRLLARAQAHGEVADDLRVVRPEEPVEVLLFPTKALLVIEIVRQGLRV